jgi:hypothetical protein
VLRRTRGYRVGRRCVRRRPRSAAARRRRCTSRTRRGTISRRAVAGLNRYPFSGRLGRRALPRGAYEMRIVATDAAGNASRQRSVSFRIVRR